MKTQNKLFKTTIYAVYSLVIIAVFTCLYYRLVITDSVGDYIDHNMFTLLVLEGSYKTMYPGYQWLVGLVYLLLHVEVQYASIIVLDAAMLASCFLTYALFKELSGKNEFNLGYLILGFLVNVIQPIFTSSIRPGYSSVNGYISPTLALNKPFVYLTILITIRYVKKYYIQKKKIALKELFLLSLVLIASCIVKPLFAMAYVPAMGLIILVYECRQASGLAIKVKNFLYNVIPLLACGFFLIGQYIYYYFFSTARTTQWSDGSMRVGFMVAWNMVVSSVPLSIIFAYFFPLVVLLMAFVTKRKTLTINEKLFSVIDFIYGIISFIYMAFLYQDSGHEADCNFRNAWCFTFFMTFVLCIEILCRWYREAKDKKDSKLISISNMHIIVPALALMVHVAFGVALILDKVIGIQHLL